MLGSQRPPYTLVRVCYFERYGGMTLPSLSHDTLSSSPVASIPTLMAYVPGKPKMIHASGIGSAQVLMHGLGVFRR